MRYGFHFAVLIAVAIASPLAAYAAPKRVAPLVNAHAHNDYVHDRPLADALEHGFTSIEADVFLVEGELLVGHSVWELRPGRTLQALYLDPLRRRVEANKGRVFDNKHRLTLLVDFKSDGPATYAALAKLLAQYEGVFSEMKDAKFIPLAVDVVISGNRPIDQITGDATRRVAIDGRLADLARDAAPDLMPLVSESWTQHFSWRGHGPMPAAERQRLRAMAAQVHEQRRRLRFWATPDDPAVWAVLLEEGVDLIGADDLAALQRFFAERTARR